MNSGWITRGRVRPSGCRWALLLVAAAGVMTAGCGETAESRGDGADVDRRAARGTRATPFRAVTTTGMVADIVRAVAVEHARVQGLIGEGVDPHLYKPTRNDVVALQESDIVFYSGLLLEGKMTDVLIKVASGGRPVVALTEKLEPQFLLEPPEFAGHPDPHVWMDVKAWRQAVDVVATALSDFDPARAHAYRAHAATYGAKLDALDDYVRKVIASIPKERRVLVTAHDAFNYFGRAYDMEVVGIQGISTESEAGLRDINERIELILSRGVPAVFVETSVSDKNVRALVEGVAARGGVLKIGGSLFSDAMGAPGSYEGTYIGMIDHNATVIARALGGDAPPRGMNGELADTD